MRRHHQFFLGALGATSLLGAGVYFGRVLAADATAQPLYYAGTVLDETGGPLGGTHRVDISLYGADQGGQPMCTSFSDALGFTSGRFRAQLAANCTKAIQDNAEAWAEVEVDGKGFGRTRLGAVPYALEAGHAVSASTAIAANTARVADHASKADSATKAGTADHATRADTSTVANTVNVDLGGAHAIQVGSCVGKSNDQGRLVCPFNRPFGSPPVSVVVSIGSADLYGGGIGVFHDWTVSNFTVGIAGGTTVRVNWIAVGQ